MDRRLRQLLRTWQAAPSNSEAEYQYLMALNRTRPEARLDQHTRDCGYVRHYLAVEAARDRYELQLEAYRAEWPDYCQSCRGWGAHYEDDETGSWEEPCHQCVYEDICARCGGSVELKEEGASGGLGDAYYECDDCGWTDHPNRRTQGAPLEVEEPYHVECTCWDDQLSDISVV